LHQRLNEATSPIPSGYLTEYLDNLSAFIALSASAQIYCSMSVEAFLNFYGVCRLGEEFYKRNLERSGIVQKLETLLESCDGILLAADEEITGMLSSSFALLKGIF
jgi:hypothetical protein